jgi:hypothetical protein
MGFSFEMDREKPWGGRDLSPPSMRNPFDPKASLHTPKETRGEIPPGAVVLRSLEEPFGGTILNR